jgi:hypothetical protein
MTKSAYARKTALISFFMILTSLPLFSYAADKKVAVLPLAMYADPGKAYLRHGIRNMLASRLSGEGLQVLGDQAVAPFLKEGEANGITSPDRAGELAELLKADYVIYGSITGTGTGFSLDLSILDRTKDQPKITNVSEAVTEDELIPRLADITYDFRAIIAGVDIRKFERPEAETDEGGRGLFFKRATESYGFKPRGRISVKMDIMSMDVGDLDGDGKEEVVVLGRDALSVYERTEQSLAIKGTMEPDMGEEFLKVSVADLDNNGKAEIYLVSLYGQRAQSSVWEWTGKFTKKLDRRAGNLHVARNLGGGQHMLLFQDSSMDKFFTGRIFIMGYDQGKLLKKDPFADLKGAQLYTLAFLDFDRDGRPDLVGLGEPRLTEESFLHVWDMQGNILAKSNEPVGGTNNAIRHGKKNPEDLGPRVLFNSKIVAMDVDNDGKKEILTASNSAMVKRIDFWLYLDANVVAFKPEGGDLVQTYKSGKIKYCLTDMQIQGDRLYIAAQEGKIATFTEGTGRILWFE